MWRTSSERVHRLLREYLFLAMGLKSLADSTRIVANADKLSFYACQFVGYQDTVYAKAGTQYYANSKIEGK